ncbi:uncharacterized protein LOC34621025 [Cyclospora cayetanensis]|uniref:Uncharacterized protein LOC34621025 n=1 Tax=Cyclospora cayetanensis TaxID=88456 RepID=A0A6P6S4X6_9EIME|nr:uncharacterized protein LOC34621025 [Cyclospora cayetanensis]
MLFRAPEGLNSVWWVIGQPTTKQEASLWHPEPKQSDKGLQTLEYNPSNIREDPLEEPQNQQLPPTEAAGANGGEDSLEDSQPQGHVATGDGGASGGVLQPETPLDSGPSGVATLGSPDGAGAAQETQPGAWGGADSGDDLQDAQYGDLSDSEESAWSDSPLSDEQAEKEEAAAKLERGAISPSDLEASSLPFSVLVNAVLKINRRYDECSDTRRSITNAEEELMSHVVDRWQEANYAPFTIEGMLVSSQEQQVLLRAEGLTPNLINVYLRALEVNKTPLHTPHFCRNCHCVWQSTRRKRPKLTSLSVEISSKLLSPSMSSEDTGILLEELERQNVLKSQVVILPVTLGPTHYATIVVDIIKGPRAALFLVRWYDPSQSSGAIPIQNTLSVLRAYIQEHGLRFFSLHRSNFVPEPSIVGQFDGRDTGVLTCMIATQMAEGCNPVASSEDMPYFRKQLLLKLDFASRWKRKAVQQ